MGMKGWNLREGQGGGGRIEEKGGEVGMRCTCMSHIDCIHLVADNGRSSLNSHTQTMCRGAPHCALPLDTHADSYTQAH